MSDMPEVIGEHFTCEVCGQVVHDLTKQLADANKILREMEIYLRKGSKQTAIYQGSGFHKEIREYFGAALSPQEPTTT